MGIKVRCRRLATALRKVRIMAGRMVTVHTTPSATPLAITRPMSVPSFRLMVHMAKKPAMVVSEDPQSTKGVADGLHHGSSATFLAGRLALGHAGLQLSSSNRCSRKIEKIHRHP